MKANFCRALAIGLIVLLASGTQMAMAATSSGITDSPKNIVLTKRALKKYNGKLILLKKRLSHYGRVLQIAKRSQRIARKKACDLDKRVTMLAQAQYAPKRIVRAKNALAKYNDKLVNLKRKIPLYQAKITRAKRSQVRSRKKAQDLKRLLATLRDKEIGVGSPAPYSDLRQLESKLGGNLDIFLWYQSMAEDFDADLANWLWSKGTKLQLAWEPHNPAKSPGNQPEYSLKTIIRGDHDANIYRWARQIKSFGKPVYFRPMSEMNGDWVAWGMTNRNSAAEYGPAWRHVHNIFTKVGAKNAKWIWSPNRDADEASAQRTFNRFYPGDSYVDYVGMNGYNWGTMYNTPAWVSAWQNFDEVFGHSYRVATRRTNKPVFIAEMGSTEAGGSKAAWIKYSYTRIKSHYPRIKAVVWFNYNKETDWRIHNRPENLDAFKRYAL